MQPTHEEAMSEFDINERIARIKIRPEAAGNASSASSRAKS